MLYHLLSAHFESLSVLPFAGMCSVWLHQVIRITLTCFCLFVIFIYIGIVFFSSLPATFKKPTFGNPYKICFCIDVYCLLLLLLHPTNSSRQGSAYCWVGQCPQLVYTADYTVIYAYLSNAGYVYIADYTVILGGGFLQGRLCTVHCTMRK